MTSSFSTWVPLEVSYTEKSVNGDDDTEVTQLLYVKKTEASNLNCGDTSASHGLKMFTDGVPVDDKSIVWPPIVILENTRLGWDEDKKKWKGMGHEDIRKFLRKFINREHAHLRVKCLFDVKGQKGCALVIFPKTVEGYIEAEALDQGLKKKSKGRMEWVRVKPKSSHRNTDTESEWNTDALVSQQGERILYGYLATPKDMERLDRHRRSVKWYAESFREKLARPARR